MYTLELLDALKTRYDLKSDYAAAKFLGLHKATVSAWKKKGVEMDDATALRVAELLDLNQGEVLAHLHAHRADRPEVRAAWEAVAKTLHGTAAGIFALVLGGLLVGGYTGDALALLPVIGLTGLPYTQ